MLPLYLYSCQYCGMWIFMVFFSSLCCWQIASGQRREMPQHFIDFGERVEAVWGLFHESDTAVVALVGIGGIGRMGILLAIFWCLCHFIGLIWIVFVQHLFHRLVLWHLHDRPPAESAETHSGSECCNSIIMSNCSRTL